MSRYYLDYHVSQTSNNGTVKGITLFCSDRMKFVSVIGSNKKLTKDISNYPKSGTTMHYRSNFHSMLACSDYPQNSMISLDKYHWANDYIYLANSIFHTYYQHAVIRRFDD